MEGPRILGRHKTRLMYANRAQIKDRGFQTMLTRATTNLSPSSSSLVSRDDLKPFNTIEQKVGSAQVRGRRGGEGHCVCFFFFSKGIIRTIPAKRNTGEKHVHGDILDRLYSVEVYSRPRGGHRQFLSTHCLERLEMGREDSCTEQWPPCGVNERSRLRASLCAEVTILFCPRADGGHEPAQFHHLTDIYRFHSFPLYRSVSRLYT